LWAFFIFRRNKLDHKETSVGGFFLFSLAIAFGVVFAGGIVYVIKAAAGKLAQAKTVPV